MPQNISADILESMIDADPSLFLLDVREQKELAMIGAIPNVINIPTWMVPKRLDELPQDTTQKIVVVCQSGSRSYDVAEFLESRGYTNVFNLTRGTLDWIIRGKKVDRKWSGTGD